MLGLVGRKEGTRQLYQEGQAVQVTFVTVLPNQVTQIKTTRRDGYRAVQLTTGKKALHKVAKTERGHYHQAGIDSGLGLWEFRLDDEALGLEKGWKLGHALTVEMFADIPWVDVTATTKGKGFAGVIKRHHFASQDATHGNSLSHRAPGSIGQRQSPRRVFKGKKMAGQLGNKTRTLKSLKVLAVYPEQHLLMLKGSVPGAPGSLLKVKRAICLRSCNSQKVFS
jgi:large subunit ribosomal protein L3